MRSSPHAANFEVDGCVFEFTKKGGKRRDVPKVSCCPLEERWVMALDSVGGAAKEFICHLSLCVRAHWARWFRDKAVVINNNSGLISLSIVVEASAQNHAKELQGSFSLLR
ncbi:unnamed protein product [Sphenostylis stenocarpa]|uniref:Uncharacterized protein n=1 Tax=Sphenostylis stenocarpa TaxID=92480 RepID=A0AA86VY03_9FABA|nr:unnamed protein product [Sphenostylis stenocarpa]